MTYKKIEIILFFPHHPEVFHYKSYNHSGLISFISEITKDARFNLTIKCHPRHSKMNKLSTYFKSIDNAKIVFEDNLTILLSNCDLAIAMESSTAIIDCLLINKPVFYASNFSDYFNDEIIYTKLLSHLNTFEFNDFSELFNKISNSNLNEFIVSSKVVEYFCKKTNSKDLKLSLNDIFKIES